ncbi:MAG: hypothetical protein EP330_09580 [Deltaproteobacteria bacterium]|nr:MAG: hypothetical protein EP330_09580 [Deltaproteobacteria bacterium]
MIVWMLSLALAQSAPDPTDYGLYPPVAAGSFTSNSPTCASSTGPECEPSRLYLPNRLVTKNADAPEVLEPLLVFLPGSGMSPQDHDLVLKTAAYAGYRALGLSYASTPSAKTACSTSLLDCTCAGDFRTEKLLGIDTSADIDVAWQDAIVPRLWEALDELHSLDPTGGWDRYYTKRSHVRPLPEDILWDQIVVSGFSQGGGHALYLSTLVEVRGLVDFEGGNDTCLEWRFYPATGSRQLVEVPAGWTEGGPGASLGAPRFLSAHRRTEPHASFVVPEGLVNLGFSKGDDVDSLGWTLLSDEVTTTDQVPRDCSGWVQGNDLDHLSMARDTCMPTDATSGDPSTSPDDAHLFAPYLDMFWQAGQ